MKLRRNLAHVDLICLLDLNFPGFNLPKDKLKRAIQGIITFAIAGRHVLLFA